MKANAFSAILISAMMASLCSVEPCAAASVNTSWVFYLPPSGGGLRQPRPLTGGGELKPFASETDQITSSSVSVFPDQNPQYTINGVNYQLVYVNIAGGASGAITIFPGSNILVQSVPVTDPPQDIDVKFVYFPVGGPCPTGQVCGSANFDEFSETLGTLIDDTFVNVFSPPTSTTIDPAAGQLANQTGSFDTTKDGVRISALNPPLPFNNMPTGGAFDKWVTGPGGIISASSKQDLVVNQHTDDYALALYRAPCPDGFQLSGATPTISQCLPVPPDCPKGESFDPDWKLCFPTCSTPGLSWNPGLEACQGCPASCTYGCYLPTVHTLVGKCKPEPLWTVKHHF